MVGELTGGTDLFLKSEVLRALDDHGAIALGMSSFLTLPDLVLRIFEAGVDLNSLSLVLGLRHRFLFRDTLHRLHLFRANGIVYGT